MLKTLFTGILIGVTLVVAALPDTASAQSVARLPGVIYGGDVGAGSRDSVALNTILTGTGSRDITLILDGAWSINTNVTIPSRVDLILQQNAIISIDAGIVFTVNGGFVAGVHNCFTGLGTAAGSGLFPYRIPEWGNTTTYDIGEGYMETHLTNHLHVFDYVMWTGLLHNSFTVLPPNTWSLWNLDVQNGATFGYGATFGGNLAINGGASVNSNITFAGETATNWADISQYLTGGAGTGSNKSFIGFAAYAASTNAGSLLAATTFTKATNMTVELYDTQDAFTNDTFTPSIPGYWLMGGAINANNGGGDGGDLYAGFIVKNGDVVGGYASTLNCVPIGQVGCQGYFPTFNGNAIMHANGTSDYFELYAYSTVANTNYAMFLSATYLGR